MNHLIKLTIEKLYERSPGQNIWHRDTISDVARSLGLSWTDINEKLLNSKLRSARGCYDISRVDTKASSHLPCLATAEVESNPALTTPLALVAPGPIEVFKLASRSVQSIVNDDIHIPELDPTFVRWGEFDTVFKAIESRMFFPIYISGLSGNGKTIMVKQACARLKREYCRVQISPETDEDDLIGGFRLLGGETVFCKGPVIKAMERGCVLLIDEIDRGSNKIMCLQGILEGEPVLIKKTGQIIVPAPGFTIIATANTKGRGSDDGRFSAASFIDEAFLERFVATIEQEYPSASVEKKIVMKHMERHGKVDEDFADHLVAWSNVIRKTHESDAIDDLISTRRLCHITHTFAIYGDRARAIKLCTARFNEDTRNAFMDLYSKIDVTVATIVDSSATSPLDSIDGNFHKL